ncbi:hypothetical protein THASP1DRAFT_24327 [Thamnocephalis sphaerospora]|uniref:Uncharacterized protein n=1 Tax=Thamnocephalis sphaerospora TaxID=78915 RepID=A0A4P9XNX1_9FUNG|nr:hypothetical protein THASP1DRAFT_24327 [Thamnocephalis sphaerospora]|eukprot:RKP07542.1 hypothetical protein THASP1DRAFT_24327 [Thamnocephalis sphaerospora]
MSESARAAPHRRPRANTLAAPPSLVGPTSRSTVAAPLVQLHTSTPALSEDVHQPAHARRRSSSMAGAALRSVVSGFLLRKKNQQHRSLAPHVRTDLPHTSKDSMSKMPVAGTAPAPSDSGESAAQNRTRKLRRRKVTRDTEGRTSVLSELTVQGLDIDAFLAGASPDAKTSTALLRRRSSEGHTCGDRTLRAKAAGPVAAPTLKYGPSPSNTLFDNAPQLDPELFRQAVARAPTMRQLSKRHSKVGVPLATVFQPVSGAVTLNAPAKRNAALSRSKGATDEPVSKPSLSASAAAASHPTSAGKIQDPDRSLIVSPLHRLDTQFSTTSQLSESGESMLLCSSPNATDSLSASPLSTAPTSPSSSTRSEAKQRSRLSITRTRSGRLRMSPGCSLASTALHAEPAVSTSRASVADLIINIADEQQQTSPPEPTSDSASSITTFSVATAPSDTLGRRSPSRESHSGRLLRALSAQAGAPHLPAGGRPRAYTTATATHSRPESYIHGGTVGSTMARAHATGSWKFLSFWLGRNRVGSDASSFASSVRLVSTLNNTIANSSGSYHTASGGAMRRRPMARPSIHTLWPSSGGGDQARSRDSTGTIDAFPRPRPWSALEPIQSSQEVQADKVGLRTHVPTAMQAKHGAPLSAKSHLLSSAQPAMQACDGIQYAAPQLPTVTAFSNTDHEDSGAQAPRPLSSPELFSLPLRFVEAGKDSVDSSPTPGPAFPRWPSLPEITRHAYTQDCPCMSALMPQSINDHSCGTRRDLRSRYLPRRRRSRIVSQEASTLQRFARPSMQHLADGKSSAVATVDAAGLRFSLGSSWWWPNASQLDHLANDSSTATGCEDAAVSATTGERRRSRQRTRHHAAARAAAASVLSTLDVPLNASCAPSTSSASSVTRPAHKRLLGPSLADELRMLIMGSWRRGVSLTASALANSSAGLDTPSMATVPGSATPSTSLHGSWRRRASRRRPRSGIHVSRPASRASVASYLGSDMEGCPRSELATLIQMEHFEGFESFDAC